MSLKPIVAPQSQGEMMKAVHCHDFAAFSIGENGEFQLRKNFKPLRSVLSLDTVPQPSLKKSHVLIQTHYAGKLFRFL